jgi:hypothetical protein
MRIAQDRVGTSNVLYIKIIRTNKSQDIRLLEYGAKMIRFQNEFLALIRLTQFREAVGITSTQTRLEVKIAESQSISISLKENSTLGKGQGPPSLIKSHP